MKMTEKCNPSSAGYKKLCTTSWVQETLPKAVTDDDDLGSEEEEVQVTLDYEIADNV